mgnify:CR=1 FL=1
MIGMLVDPKSSGVKITRTRNHADDSLYQDDFNNVIVSAADVLETKNFWGAWEEAVSYTHLRAHATVLDVV